VYCYLSLRLKHAGEANPSKDSNRRADEELSQRSKISHHGKHQPGQRKDNDPNRQMPEENPPQIGCPYGATPSNIKIVNGYPNQKI
jgi:hypothetical protein